MSPPRFGRTTSDYARHRPAFAPPLYERLRSFGIGLREQQILDLGAGTGLFSRPLIEAGATVTCVDVSAELLAHAGRGINAAAEMLPFADATFDVVCAAQCWHWFDRDHAPREINRVLKPGAALAVVYQMYVPLRGSVAEQTERIIVAHTQGWRHANSAGINGQVLRDVQINGFVEIESFSFDVEMVFTRETWSGFVRTLSAVGAQMSELDLERFERSHDEMLADISEPFKVPHRVFAVVTRTPRRL